MRNLTGNKIFIFFIYAYIVIVMASKSTGSMGVKIIRVVLAATFVFYLMANRNRFYKPSFYTIWSLTFLIYNTIMCRYALNPEYAKDYTMTLMFVVIVNLMIEYYMFENDITEKIMHAIIIGAIVQGIYIYTTNGFLAFLNARGASGISANAVGLNNAIALVFSIYFIKKKSHKSIYMLEAVIVLIFMILSGSRKTFVMAGAPLIIYYLLNSRDFAITIRNIILIVIAVIVVYKAVMEIPFLYNMVGVRIETMLSGFSGGDTDGSTETRLKLIEYGLEWYKQRPWFGHGLSNYIELMHRYRPRELALYAHNNYVELLVDCGIVGFAIYYISYVVTLIKGLKCIKNRNSITIMMFGFVVGSIICDYGLVSYYEPIYQLLLFLCFRTLSYDKQRV